MLSEHTSTRARFSAGVIPALAQFWRRHQALLTPLSIALVSRLIVFVAADLIMRFALIHRHYALPFTGPISVWQRKDALWYIAIPQSGYNYTPFDGSRANFFPLYPLLIYIFEPLFATFPVANPYALTGMVVSWLTFAGACVGLYRLTRDRFGQRAAFSAVMLLCVFPFSLYYGAAYTESIYLVLAVWAFVAIERGQWWVAGALAGLACASRPPGLLIGACVAFAYLLDWIRTRHPLRFNVLALALTPLGTVGYMIYCWVSWGDPIAYIKTSEAGWHGGHAQLGGVLYIAHALRHPISWVATRDPDHILAMFAMLVMLSFLALTPLVLRLLGPTYALFAVASILAPILDFPNANSLGRYLSVIFPIFIVVAYLLRGHQRTLGWLYALSGVLLILFATYFIAGYGLS